MSIADAMCIAALAGIAFVLGYVLGHKEGYALGERMEREDPISKNKP